MHFKDDVAILSLSGKFLAGSDGPYLRQKVKDLVEAGSKKLILDFADVPYIDSTGLGFLAGSRVTAQNAGVRLILAAVNQHVRRILDDLNLSQFFVITAGEADALDLLSKPPSAAETARTAGEASARKSS
jgi:anti-sigma B factor antagonist